MDISTDGYDENEYDIDPLLGLPIKTINTIKHGEYLGDM